MDIKPQRALVVKPTNVAHKGDTEMDFNRVLLLLTVTEKASGHPQLKPVRDAALSELYAMVQPEPVVERKPTPIFPPEPGDA
jgi:hypothetical protein